ncbi:hypothetical protein [Paenibacillus dendrobii]|nr:hypothetical protein [Paenibacillus dendrobii]
MKRSEQGAGADIRKISYAVLSLVLILIGYVFSVNITPELCLGDRILEAAGLNAWERPAARSGFHYSILYGLGFVIAGWLVARVTLKHRLPKLYKSIPAMILVLLFIGPLVLRLLV